MILTVPFSHTDAHQTLKLVRWLGWLSSLDHNSMKKEKILLVPSRSVSPRRIHREICAAAARIFGEARSYTPEREYESGWPGACNFMMKAALEHVEQYFQEDMFLLEPDAIPLLPEWYVAIQAEWEFARSQGKEFMGARVHYPDLPPHMTGIGVYGRDWRKCAPKLAEVQNECGWDMWARDQVVPNARFTDLIQHIWWKAWPAPYEMLNYERVDPMAVIFHQDKEGRLFAILDEECWGGRADRVVLYSQQRPEDIMETHYFFTSNANRPYSSHGLDLRFDPLAFDGGVWSGAAASNVEAEVLALKALVSDSGSGVKEISKDEFVELTKKKPVSLPPLKPLPSPSLQPAVARIDQSPAVLVEGGKPDDPAVAASPVVENIEDVIKVTHIKPSEPAKRTKKPLAKKKKTLP